MPRAIEKRDWGKGAEGCPPNLPEGLFDGFGTGEDRLCFFGLLEKMRLSA